MAGRLSQAAQPQAGAPIVPQLAQAAAAAGAPGPQQQQAPGGPPQAAPGGPPQAAPGGPPQPMPGGPPQPMPGGQPQQAGPRKVDPSAPSVEGKMPLKEEQASPEEQQEYERGMKALSRALYENDKVAEGIVNQIDPKDKVSSTTKANLMFIQQLDQKIQMAEVIIPQMTQEVTARIIELAEARHGIEYGGRESQVILGSTWEGVQEMFGGEPQGMQGMIDELGPEGVAGLAKQHEAFLNG